MLLKSFQYNFYHVSGHIVLQKDVTVNIEDFCHEGMYLVFNVAKVSDTYQNTFHMNDRA